MERWWWEKKKNSHCLDDRIRRKKMYTKIQYIANINHIQLENKYWNEIFFSSGNYNAGRRDSIILRYCSVSHRIVNKIRYFDFKRSKHAICNHKKKITEKIANWQINAIDVKRSLVTFYWIDHFWHVHGALRKEEVFVWLALYKTLSMQTVKVNSNILLCQYKIVFLLN